MNWHLLPVSDIAQLLSTTPSGIDDIAGNQRLAEYGKNVIEAKKKTTVLQVILHQFTDFMIVILIVAAIVSGILGDTKDTIIIIAIVIINAIVGFIQEYRVGKAMEALNSLAAIKARVLRDGNPIDISASDLVPGDVVLLEAGNIIPADVRFIETHQIKVDESSLTGESHNSEKNTDQLPEGEYSLGDRSNMGFKGTIVTNGRGVAYVVTTGMNTELALIAKLVQTEESLTPLQKRLSGFGKKLSVVILVLCALYFFAGWLRGGAALTMLITSISLAVAAIPEALPIVITIALAFGAKRLVKSNALIRKLPAVETLGSITYICSDKTGTLTQNKMTVQEIFEVPDSDSVSVFPEGRALLYAMALNNDVSKSEDDKWLGDSTEVGLVQYAIARQVLRSEAENKFPRIAELPFDAHRKCMTTIHQAGDIIISVTKGAVDVLLQKLDGSQKTLIPEFEAKANEMAEKGFRVLGYAVKILSSLPEKLNSDTIERSLLFIGFVGMIDPPREEAKNAITQCREAGIIPVMITGDHILTATAIAKTIGIINADSDLAINGTDLSKLTQVEFEKIVEKIRVYARVNPEQKLKIIKALQDKQQFVAMTGDGVNDAPALKNADIGIAMGITGTEVSKEAAHMILLDDNFATIVNAISFGRKIFDNILKFIKYIMAGNAGELLAMVIAPAFGLPIPFQAIHILWINLITDGLPGLALASEPAEANIMKRPPRKPGEAIFTKGMIFHILFVGVLIGAATIAMQAWAIRSGILHWQTMAFNVLCLVQMGHIMAIRSEWQSLFKIGVFSNKPMIGALLVTFLLQLAVIYAPFMNDVFHTQPLSFFELCITIVASSIVFWLIEFKKWIARKRGSQ
jgi:Ca2+-transporting ATPase